MMTTDTLSIVTLRRTDPERCPDCKGIAHRYGEKYFDPYYPPRKPSHENTFTAHQCPKRAMLRA